MLYLDEIAFGDLLLVLDIIDDFLLLIDTIVDLLFGDFVDNDDPPAIDLLLDIDGDLLDEFICLDGEFCF